MTRQNEYREAAAQCLDIAQTTVDENARARLLLLAQKFNELAKGSGSDVVLARLLDHRPDAKAAELRRSPADIGHMLDTRAPTKIPFCNLLFLLVILALPTGIEPVFSP
jgi:hypothetical protein